MILLGEQEANADTLTDRLSNGEKLTGIKLADLNKDQEWKKATI